MKNLIKLIKHWKEYIYWKKKRNGKVTIDLVRNTGYYIPIGINGYSPIGEIREISTKEGKVALMRLLSYQPIAIGSDVVKKSHWELIGYKDTKSIKDCSFEEFLTIYPNLLKNEQYSSNC